MEYQSNSRLQEILNLPLRIRCYELSIFCEQLNIRDLNEIFPHLVSAIFGVNSDNIGFGLRLSIENTDSFNVLYDFFNPHSAFFRVIYRLTETATFKYELPMNQLPNKLQQMLESGRYSSFYSERLAIDPFHRQISGLSLNAFDYFMFHFVLHGIKNLKVPAAMTINNEKLKSVYFALSADYLCSFLPGDPNAVILPQIFGASQQAMSPQIIPSIKPTKSPKYLLLSALSHQQQSDGIRNVSASPSNSPKSWRTESVLHIFVDVFLQFDDGRDLPSNEFIRVVRIMIKQLHDFSNSADIDNTAMRTLRQQAQNSLNARFYPFLKSIITRWPLDSSFSYVLEMYLSYIQPWRYYFNRNLNKIETPIVGKYAKFVAENLICYTQIFVRLLSRFQRMDLSSFKNVLMLYRLLKVFNQSNLIDVIKSNETTMMANSSMTSTRSASFHQNSLDSSHHSQSHHSSNRSPNVSFNQSSLTQHDDSNYIYMTLSDEVMVLVMDLMRRIIAARMRVNELIQRTEKDLHQKFGIFERIVRFLPFLLNFSTLDASFTSSLEENRQIPEILNFALGCFSHVYNVDVKQLEEELTMSSKYRVDKELESYMSSTHNESSNYLNITPVVMRSQVSSIQYMGDPELIPIKSTENTFLVRFLYQLSCALNRMFENNLQLAWNRPDLVGKVSRQLLCAPMEIQVFDKSRGISELKREYLKPRISLRFLASHKSILVVGSSILFGYLFWNSPILGFLFLFFISIICVIIKSVFTV